MSNKKLALLLSTVILVVGGLIFHVYRMSETEKLEAQILKEQDRMVLYALNHYEGVEKIEFTSFEKNDMTGSWLSYAVANDRFDILFTLKGFNGDITVAKGRDAQTGEYLRIRNNEEVSKDTNSLEVVYWRSDR